MRFLHTSDWHIGRILFERSLLEDQEYILEQFVDLVRRSEVDLVVIATFTTAPCPRARPCASWTMCSPVWFCRSSAPCF